MPVAHAGRYSQKYVSNDIVQAELGFLNEHKENEKILWISSAPYPAFLTLVNCTSPVIVAEQPQMLKHHLIEANYDAIYLSQGMDRVGTNTFECVEYRDNLDPSIFKFEAVREIRMDLDNRLVISRIHDVILQEKQPKENHEE
jgi:hypothetical protein